MKPITLFSFLLMIFISGNLRAQQDENMKKYTEYMSPGPKQLMLAKMVGQWTGAVSITPKDGPANNSTLETSFQMIMGERYLQSDNKGSMWGMPFQGTGTTGYDNATKKYVSTWIDNMGTGIIFLEGEWDEATKSIKMKGKSTDPLTGKDIPTREDIQLVDNNHMILTMYFTEGLDLKEFKGMEIKYIRK